MAPDNERIARVLAELARLTELDEGDPNAFRVRAYRNASRAVEALDRQASDLSADELAKVRGIGKSIAARIREYVDTGHIERLDTLRAEHPPQVAALRDIPGLGPKSVRRLVDELGISDVADLVAALEDGRVEALDGFGQATVDKVHRGIEQLGLTSKQRRVPLAEAVDRAERIVRRLAQAGASRVVVAGSARRCSETVGDLDLLVARDASGSSLDVRAALEQAVDIETVLGHGLTKVSVIAEGLQIDVRMVDTPQFGAALLYFTGSRDHNIRLRQRAIERGWTLNEYGLSARDDHAEAVPVDAATDEEKLYAALGLAWIPPEIREDVGEIEAAEGGDLPSLVSVDDLQGDLHVHTDLSGDGRDTLEAMVAAAVDDGLQYLAITDHAELLAINGASRHAMEEQRRQLRQLEQRRGDIRLLHGAELNIDAAGQVDYDAQFLATFDWLVASVHSSFDLPADRQTARIVTAMRNPAVTAIGHLTGRMIGRRPGIDIDVDKVLDAAIETGTALEINASLRRLEPPVPILREAARRGVALVVSTDAHAVRDYARRGWGAAHARRAWVESSAVVNTRDAAEFERWLADRR